jgi:DNA-directed RNA polymerase specialized sigma24 family protein
MAEIAQVLGVAVNTVSRDWRMARAWLFDRLRSPSASPLHPA